MLGRQSDVELIARILEDDALTLVDVGAAGDLEPRWRKIAALLHYIGFEPDRRSRDVLAPKGRSCRSYRMLPFAVWETDGRLELNLCKDPQKSSHYGANLPFVSRFPDVHRFAVASTTSLEAKRLDGLDINADFMKLDLQGGELAALAGAHRLLGGCLGVEVEVEFTPIYQSQPLFGEVCSFLQGEGFEFVDFVSLRRWERSAFNGYGQCVFGDALFMRPPEALFMGEAVASASLTRFAAICALYNRFDWIDTSLELARAQGQPSLSERALEAVARLRRRHVRARRMAAFLDRVTRRVANGHSLHLLY